MMSSKARGGPLGSSARVSMEGISCARVVAKVAVGRWEERESWRRWRSWLRTVILRSSW